jgi:hypothetical protein
VTPERSSRRDRGAGGSPMGRVYRETTPAMLARVTAALDDRIAAHKWLLRTCCARAGIRGWSRGGEGR